MKPIRYGRGEISLGYLLKIGGAAGLSLAINGIFDSVIGIIDIYRVQTVANSPRVEAVKDCVYETMMSGSHSRLAFCSDKPFMDTSDPVIEVRHDGVVVIKDRIQDTPFTLKLAPSHNARGSLTWQCRGRPAKYMPRACTEDPSGY